MTKKSIFCARIFVPSVMERLASGYNLFVNENDELMSDTDLMAALEGMDALMLMPPQKILAKQVAMLPSSIKAVGTNSVGLDHLDLPALKAKGIKVYYTPNVLNDSTAETGLLLMLAAARRANEGFRHVRDGQWVRPFGPAEELGIQMTGKRLGIFGMGRIGQTIADMARGFNMQIHYHNRSKLTDESEKGAVYHQTLESLMGVSDFFMVAAPSTPTTRKSINEQTLSLLPDNAVLANIARGDLVDDDALIQALKTGKVAAAGLDVFDGEPDIHPAYLQLDNVFVLPHWGSATNEGREAMGMAVVDGFDACFNGYEVSNKIA